MFGSTYTIRVRLPSHLQTKSRDCKSCPAQMSTTTTLANRYNNYSQQIQQQQQQRKPTTEYVGGCSLLLFLLLANFKCADKLHKYVEDVFFLFLFLFLFLFDFFFYFYFVFFWGCNEWADNNNNNRQNASRDTRFAGVFGFFFLFWWAFLARKNTNRKICPMCDY